MSYSKVMDVVKIASEYSDRRSVRNVRKEIIKSMTKVADFGILQNPSPNVHEFESLDHEEEECSGRADSSSLYGVKPEGYPENEKRDLEVRQYSKTLSTRYSPDRPGTQALRISDGIYQDPYTGKIYNWNEGFKTETGDEYSGGSVTIQTQVYSR